MYARPTPPGGTWEGVPPWLLPVATTLPPLRAVPLQSTWEMASSVLFRYANGRREPSNAPISTTDTFPDSPSGRLGVAVPLRSSPSSYGQAAAALSLEPDEAVDAGPHAEFSPRISGDELHDASKITAPTRATYPILRFMTSILYTAQARLSRGVTRKSPHCPARSRRPRT